MTFDPLHPWIPSLPIVSSTRTTASGCTCTVGGGSPASYASLCASAYASFALVAGNSDTGKNACTGVCVGTPGLRSTMSPGLSETAEESEGTRCGSASLVVASSQSKRGTELGERAPAAMGAQLEGARYSLLL